MFGEAKIKTFGFLYFVGSVDVTGTYAEDVAVTSHQDVFAPVPVGESTYGGFVDGSMC